VCSVRRPAPASSSPREADLAPLARALGLTIPHDALEQLGPAVWKMYADLERLRGLPIDDRAPALPALARASSVRPEALR
jgi:hypothetical protein